MPILRRTACGLGRMRQVVERLHEPFAHSTLVLEQEHRTKIDEFVRRRLVERPEHRLAVVNRQAEDLRSERERFLELLCDFGASFAKDACELDRVAVGDRGAGKLHQASVDADEVDSALLGL